MKKDKPKINNHARVLLGLVLLWEVLAISYVLIKQNFFEHKLSVEHTLIVVFIILAPPLLVLMVKIMFPSVAWFNQATASTRRKNLLKEITRSFPLMLQLFSIVFVTFTLIESSALLEKFTQLFLFITFCVSVADSYYRQSYLFSCFFVIFACLYNPFYLIELPDFVFTLALMGTFFLFVFYVMYSVRNNHYILSESSNAAQVIGAQLQWIIKEVPHYDLALFQNMISRKYPERNLQKVDCIEWYVMGAPNLVFAAMNIFNDEIVIVIRGVKPLKGFRAYYIFYNQGFRKMVCLERKSSYGARLLQEKLVEDYGFHILKIDYSQSKHIAI